MRVLMGLAALSVLGAAAGAQAASVTYTDVFPGPSSANGGYAATDWDGTAQSVALPRFNPALGTLTGVRLSLSGGIRATGTMTNTGTDDADITSYRATMDIGILAPGTLVPFDPTVSVALLTVSPELFSIGAPLTLAPGQTYSFGGNLPVSATDAADAPVITSLAPYVGTGSLTFPLIATTHTDAVTTGGDLEIAQTTFARAQASATYTYDVAATTVPEPATAALLGAGLLTLSLLRRR